MLRIRKLLDPRGTISGRFYLQVGIALFIVKYLIDRVTFHYLFKLNWLPWSYFSTPVPLEPDQASSAQSILYTSLLLSLPFLWIGICLTLKRLRALELPYALSLLFFIPVVNLIFFLILALLPDHFPNREQTGRFSFAAIVPKDDIVRTAILGIFVSALLGVLLVLMSTALLDGYGLGLFIGAPFFVSFLSVLIYSTHQQRTLLQCSLQAWVTLLLLAGLLLVFAIEGILCLVMATPLALIVGFMGGLFGYLIQRVARATHNSIARCAGAPILLLTLVFQIDSQVEAPLYSSSTEIVIDAPIETIWNHVVSFSDLPEPSEWIFKTGIAYPIRARIDGEGVGAIRYCEFSTGPFIEPITEWNEPHRLAFDVISTPPPMREWSLFAHIEPGHLEGFFHSRKGSFELTELPEGGTLLRGTTWYQHRIAPARYWRVFSDRIVHAIHLRVLRQIKNLSEQR